MRLDNPVTDREPQTSSPAHILGGEERIKDTFQIFFRYTAAGVDDRYRHHWFSICCRYPRIQRTAGAYGDVALFLAGMLGVDNHVHDHLLDLIGVDPDWRQATIEIEDDLDVRQMRRLLAKSHGAGGGLS